MIGFILLQVLQISAMVAGHNICNKTTNEPNTLLHIQKLNKFSVDLYKVISKNSTGNLIITPLTAWPLIEIQTRAESDECSKSLSAIISRIYEHVANNREEVPGFLEKKTTTHERTIMKVEYYITRKNTSFEGKIHGVTDPKVMRVFLPMPDRTTKEVLMMDFTVNSSYPLFLAFKTQVMVLSLGSKLKMTIVLPGEGISLGQTEQVFTDAQSQGLIYLPTSQRKRMVRIQLPAIEIHSEINMTKPLTQAGLGNKYFDINFFLEYQGSTELITTIVQSTTISVKDFVLNVKDEKIGATDFFIVHKPFLVEISDDDVIIFKGRVINIGK